MTSCHALSLLHRRADVVDFELNVSINVLFTDHTRQNTTHRTAEQIKSENYDFALDYASFNATIRLTHLSLMEAQTCLNFIVLIKKMKTVIDDQHLAWFTWELRIYSY